MADIGNVIKRLFTTPNHRFLISEADSQAAETAKVIYDDKTGSPAENLSFTIPTGNPPPPPPPECPPGQHRDENGNCVPDNPPPPPPEEIVKAKVLTATASKQDSGKEASKVLDGDFETRWSADGIGEWIDFTFDRIYTLKKVKLTGYWYDKSYTFSINAQADFTCPANRQPNTLIEFDISGLGIVGDRVRLIGKGNSATSYNSYREVEFWGVAGDVPPPPPPPEDCPPGQHRDPVTGQCVPDSPPPPPTGTTRLIAFADNDTTNDAEDVLKAIMQVPNVSEYEFVGDGPYSKSGTKWVSMMKKYFSTTDKLRISQGNHDEKESESNQTEKDIEEWIPSLNKSPEGLDWTSSGQVGNVYVISGNTQDMDVEFKRDQYNWLVSELDKAKQLRAAGQIDWIVYLAHKPFFTLKSSHSPYTAVRHLYKDIFKNVVDFVIHGHNHNTQLWKPMIPNASDANGEGQQLFSLMPDGKTYDFTKDHGWLGIVTGHAGHEWNGINDSGSGVQNVMHYRDSGKFGFTQLDFEGKTATVKSIDTNGTVHFEYKVSRGSDSPPPPPPPGNLNAKFPELIKRAVPGTIVVLDGSQSTGPIISYNIVQTAGNPTVELHDFGVPAYSKRFVMPDTNEPLLFVLQVHDTAGNTDTDTISVIKDLIPNPPPGNFPVNVNWYYSSDQVLSQNASLTSSKYISNESPNQILLPSGASGAKNHKINDGWLEIDSGGGNGRVYWDYVKNPTMKADPKYGKAIAMTGTFKLQSADNLSIKDGNHGTDGSIIEDMDLVFGGFGLSFHETEVQSKVEYNHDVSQGNEESKTYPNGKKISRTGTTKYFITIVANDSENAVKLNAWLDFGQGWELVMKDRTWKQGDNSWKPPSGIPSGKDKAQIEAGPAHIVRNHIWTRANDKNLQIQKVQIGIPI